MKTLVIKLDTINDVKNFVNIVSKYDFDMDLMSGRYAVDAKSIMGIFSLDLAKPIKMEIYSDDCPDLMSEIQRGLIRFRTPARRSHFGRAVLPVRKDSQSFPAESVK